MNNRFKITFQCQHCGESFKVDFNRFIEKNALGCPNCDQAFDEYTLRKFQNAMETIKNVVTMLNLAPDTQKEDPKWRFSFEIDYITTR